VAIQEGFREYLEDFANDLNFRRLNRPLIFEHLQAHGVDSACINYMWFRGEHQHHRHTPAMLALTVGRLGSTVHGPRFLKLGDFVHTLPEGLEEIDGETSGLLGRYGFHDTTTAACVLGMAKHDSLPPFTLAYFPLNDFVAHEEGLVHAAETCVKNFDQFLGEMIETLGGLERFTEENAVVIVGDHAQIEWEDGPSTIRLDRVLDEFNLADAAKGFAGDDEVLIAPNMRAAAVYLATEDEEKRSRVVDRLLAEGQIDQVLHVETPDGRSPIYHVETRDRGSMQFQRAGDDEHFSKRGKDKYGNAWCYQGELGALDLFVDGEGHFSEGAYPNPLERIAGALSRGSQPIWVTARCEAEFSVFETSVHEGGSHGSLHRDDSEAALVCNFEILPPNVPPGVEPRITDVMDLCLGQLGLSRAASERTRPVTS
jgi:hypothetical protein